MDTCLALLRGINVGGHNKVPMATLRSVFDEAGYKDVRTYIQSGNVVFTADTDDLGALYDQLPAILRQRFGWNIPLILRTTTDIDAIVDANPLAQHDFDPAQLTVFFLADTIAPDIDFAVPVGSKEQVFATPRQLYVHYPNGISNSKLPSRFFDTRLSGNLTTVRNWRTVLKLREMMH